MRNVGTIRPRSKPTWTELSGLAVCFMACLALGCGRDYCVEGLDIGTKYRVTVLEPANDQSQYGVQASYGRDFGVAVGGGRSCGAGFDFVSGSTFTVEPVSKVDMARCYGRRAIPGEIAEVRLIQEDGYSFQGGTLMVTPVYEIERGAGCIGRWQLGFISPHNAPPLSPPHPGEYPPVILARTFDATDKTDQTSCLLQDSKLVANSYCTDYFVISLEKQ
jgi:hypothetical protein